MSLDGSVLTKEPAWLVVEDRPLYPLRPASATYYLQPDDSLEDDDPRHLRVVSFEPAPADGDLDF